jgi:hypothetical protein
MPLASLVFRCVSYLPKRAEARARYLLLADAVGATHAHLDTTTDLDMRAKLLRLLSSQLAELARAHEQGFSRRQRPLSVALAEDAAVALALADTEVAGATGAVRNPSACPALETAVGSLLDQLARTGASDDRSRADLYSVMRAALANLSPGLADSARLLGTLQGWHEHRASGARA